MTVRLPIALLCASALTACTVGPAPPAGPSLAAMPGNGKTPAQFAADDTACRAQANAANSGMTPGQAASQSAAGTVAGSTLVGAGLGALFGAAGRAAGPGAAIGGGAGLLAGLLTAGRNANISGAAFQRNYDAVYFHCIAAAGDRVPTLFAAAPPYPYRAYPAYPYPYYAPPVGVVPPPPPGAVVP
jgi:hypothetical protein